MVPEKGEKNNRLWQVINLSTLLLTLQAVCNFYYHVFMKRKDFLDKMQS